ncbi:MAG: hypothetical protein COW01_02710 [Bdellovibrionales bacterium CG12_big_fil_rev_8_21_14_0_65_38_15]|nr:MAG: hypothetical protein COW79_08375 [Bdellovibrionales bacterium CG22_combo_CG10-13_8_21_14_all_38_13]PIQ57004.1 MAG: hypothetical protein COW01_02710 [Bdellovibrionales bacterium CG12_big_fil_rev_8_21_14_0_65_38_15]PIR29035.1 MAG: hypothetical protein COV38_12410 [Bdellovibrionales bacterium CG11_big_fil_rev_8_21_14_0_20_38_13]
MKNKSILIILFIVSNTLNAKTNIDWSYVLNNVHKNYPLLLKQQEEFKAAIGETQSASGAFDSYLSAKHDERLDGYYDGKITTLQAVKPLAFLNSELGIGARKSSNTFPVYEGKNDTLDDGEFFARVKLSLMQNRAIDPNRANLRQRKIQQEIKGLELNQKQLEAQQKATSTYWKWFYTIQNKRITKELYDLAQRRQEMFSKKFKAGDTSKLKLLENNQYILKRKALLESATLDELNARIDLSLWLWNDKGEKIHYEDLNQTPNEELAIIPENIIDDKMLETSPLIQILNNEILYHQVNQEIGENKLQPKLDLTYDFSKDKGAGSRTLEGDEHRVLLELKIPLERDLGRGKIQSSVSKMNAKKQELLYLKSQLSMYFIKYQAMMKTLLNNHKTYLNEVELAKKLVNAEKKQFDAGQSSLFMINIREEKQAESEIKAWKTLYEYYSTLASFLTFANKKIQSPEDLVSLKD